ncbi:MAG: DUF1127 domain-containing protein [Pseudomonadota bacterium]
MAHSYPLYASNTENSGMRHALRRVFGFFGSLFSSVSRAAEAEARFHRISELQNLTDEELAARHLTREEIVRHVFRDIYYS